MSAVAKRQDVHRPSVMDPADYAWIGAEDAHRGAEYDFEFDWRTFARLTGHSQVRDRDYRDAEGIPWAAVSHAGGRRGCDHCGQTRIRYWTFYLHVPSGEVVAVGQECARKLGLASRAEIAQRAEVERRRIAEELAKWRGEDERNGRAYDELLRAEDEAGGSGGAGNDFVDSLLRYARKNGRLSDAQRDAVLKGIEVRAQRAAERAEKAAELGDPEPAPVVEGRIVIEGRLLSTKTQESAYSPYGTLKMLVLDDRGFKVWGTAPGVIIDEAFELAVEEGKSSGGVAGALREGLVVRVRFTATVERSKDDETFGFFKRPTKAAVLPQRDDSEEE